MSAEFDETFDLIDEDEEEATSLGMALLGGEPDIPFYPALARFGRYEILGRVARGGMAEVYLARDRDEDGEARHLVVKRILPGLEQEQSLLDLFLKEGAMARRLYHPNVCHVYDCGEIEGQTYMTLEWVWGPSLQSLFERSKKQRLPLPWDVVAHIGAKVADALQYVHHAKGVDGLELNIIHRDVSPQNVMITWMGFVKLLDFGIARVSGSDTERSAAGKYNYMSPEQAKSQPVDPRSDIFALGIVLHELLTGQALYDRGTLFETLGAIVNEPPKPPSAAESSIPAGLDAVVLRALAKEKESRYPTAKAFAEDLRNVLAQNRRRVTEGDVRRVLDRLYSEGDKKPLKPGSAELTSSFQILTPHGRAVQRDEVSTYEEFTHNSSRPPRRDSAPTVAPQAMVSAEDRDDQIKRILMVVVATLGFASLLMLGALAWLLLA